MTVSAPSMVPVPDGVNVTVIVAESSGFTTNEVGDAITSGRLLSTAAISSGSFPGLLTASASSAVAPTTTLPKSRSPEVTRRGPPRTMRFTTMSATGRSGSLVCTVRTAL